MKPYPVNKETKRPFRLWDAQAKKAMPWRCYKHMTNAHNGALIEVRWANVSVTIEVVDIRTGKLIGQYTRGVEDIKFMKG